MRVTFFSGCLAVLLAAALATFCPAEEKTERFDADPQWDGRNHRASVPGPQLIRQDFGYSNSQHAGGGAAGEVGGWLTPAAEAAYYAKPIAEAGFDDALSVSGKLNCAGNQFHVLVGFFNAGSVGEWRTPNSIFVRLYGRGDVFYAYVEYCTGRWRAGGDSPGGFATTIDPDNGRPRLRGFPRGEVHEWSLVYDPQGNGGGGSITATIGDETAVCHLDPGHKADGATFNRCGLLSIPKSYDQGGEVWLDDLAINGQLEGFDAEPAWEAVGNRRNYESFAVRPRFDFGFSETHFAGGAQPGELGGVVFRGDNGYAERLAYYGDRLETLSPAKPLRAAGKVALRRGVSDSTVLIGFFDTEESLAVSGNQSSGFPMNFLGAAIEGPSSEGFQFYPVYRFPAGAGGYARGAEVPHILPDGAVHDWTLEYDPQAGDHGRLTLTFDGQVVPLELSPGHRDAPARFNRFGIVTTWIDGNAQTVYFDDLTYTWRQE